MINKQTKTLDHISITFDQNFIRSLTLLSKRKIEPITIENSKMLSKRQNSVKAEHCSDVGNEDMIIGIKCPVVMDEDTFEQDKEVIESDILKTFADILNSEICNRKPKKTISPQANRKRVKYTPFPCPQCGSTNTIGYGHRITSVGLKAKRHCENCNRSYTNQKDAIWKMKNKQDIIEEALKLSEEYSLRDTARLIKEKFGVKISYATVSNWRKNKKLQELNLIM
jgi:transposase-like protein